MPAEQDTLGAAPRGGEARLARRRRPLAVRPLPGVAIGVAFFSDRALEWLAAAAGASLLLLLLIPSFFRPGSVGMGESSSPS